MKDGRGVPQRHEQHAAGMSGALAVAGAGMHRRNGVDKQIAFDGFGRTPLWYRDWALEGETA